MGWTVLYIAFGGVALWLLGEVLLQYKARLRWRLLAFVGFLVVVLGVLIPSVVVIGAGAAAFAIGQTYVTLSFRRGFAAGWAVRRHDDEPVKGRRGRAGRRDPSPEVSDLETPAAGHHDADADHGGSSAARTMSYGPDDDHDDVFTPARTPAAMAAESTTVYEPQPIPDDTGSYGVYGDPASSTAYASTAQTAAGDQSAYGYDYSGYGQYGYDTTGQQQYAAYSDPYIGTQTYGGASYDTTYGGSYDQQGYGQDPYLGGYDQTTPPDGVWVPQQRTDDSYGGELPQEQPYPYQQGTGTGQQQAGHGFDEQYRF
ncbi:hypothetical protein [Streptomyces sp. NPDC014006]|uniref:SCO2102 family sporulation regulator n=1 Tax=Streptomyces sp. NPDC014006 TaxID=3364870 RepID=UPI0036FF2D20